MTSKNDADNDLKDFSLKVGLAEMLKGGVIMDVTNVEQAKIAEASGAVAVIYWYLSCILLHIV